MDALVAGAVQRDGAQLVATVVDGVSGQDLLDLADRLKAKLGDAAIVLGAVADDKVDCRGRRWRRRWSTRREGR